MQIEVTAGLQDAQESDSVAKVYTNLEQNCD